MTSIPLKIADRKQLNSIASVIASLIFVIISTIFGIVLDQLLGTYVVFAVILSVTSVLQVLFGLSVVSHVIAKILSAEPLSTSKISEDQKEALEKILLDAKEVFDYPYDVRLLIIPHYSINALSVGIHKHEHLILVSLGAVEKLSNEEIKGLVFHEMFHIKHGDTYYLTCLSGTFGAPFLVYTLATEKLNRVRKESKKVNGDEAKKLTSQIIFSVTVLTLTMFLKPIGLLANLLVNPRKDLEADLYVASLIGSEYYASIFEKIISDCLPLTENYYFIRHLFFTHPNCKDVRMRKMNKILSVYPSVQERFDSVVSSQEKTKQDK